MIDVKIYVCNDCEKYFKKEELEFSGVSDEFDTEYFDICPGCKSSNITCHSMKLHIAKRSSLPEGGL